MSRKPKRAASTFGVKESLGSAETPAQEAPAGEGQAAPAASPAPAPQPAAAPPVPSPAAPERPAQPAAPAADEPAPAPKPTTRATTPTRKSTVARRTPPSGPDRGVAALEGQHPTGGGGATPAAPHPDAREVLADYATPAWHPRVKDPTASTSTDLIDEMMAVQAEWTAANRSRLSGRSQPPPTNSGFREALLRLGLKHLNDPEFIELIPPDARRRQRR